MRISFLFRPVVGILSALFLFPLSVGAVQTESADREHKNVTGPSGLPLPRFVSLKANRVNVRVGPDQDEYAIAWSYRRQGLPVEIVQEYDHWRRIRDSDGDMGWVNQALLSGRRTVIATPWQKDKTRLLMLRRKPAPDSRPVARVEPGVIGRVRACDGEWCQLDIGRSRGWLPQDQLWGVYPGEQIN